jgi:hypothetical protein
MRVEKAYQFFNLPDVIRNTQDIRPQVIWRSPSTPSATAWCRSGSCPRPCGRRTLPHRTFTNELLLGEVHYCSYRSSLPGHLTPETGLRGGTQGVQESKRTPGPHRVHQNDRGFNRVGRGWRKRGRCVECCGKTNGDSPGCTSSSLSPERIDEAFFGESPLEKSIAFPGEEATVLE